MTLWNRFRFWVLAVLGRRRMEREMDAELRFHLEAFAEDLVRTGMPREDALRRARIEFGGIERAKEECRDARGVNFIESLIQDLRYGFRNIRNKPLFSSLVIGMLALGIAGNAAIFSIFNSLFLRPLPFAESDRLVDLDETAPKWNLKFVGISNIDAYTWMDGQSTFDGMAYFTGGGANLSDNSGLAQRVQTGTVTYRL